MPCQALCREPYLVRLDGGNLFVLLDKIADLCRTCQRSIWLAAPQTECSVGGRGRLRFDHCFNVPSVIDSAICGTLTMVSA